MAQDTQKAAATASVAWDDIDSMRIELTQPVQASEYVAFEGATFASAIATWLEGQGVDVCEVAGLEKDGTLCAERWRWSRTEGWRAPNGDRRQPGWFDLLGECPYED